MRSCIFAGSFDPITLGHKDIIMRAARDFDTVYVAVAEETGKNTVSIGERMALVNLSFKEEAGIKTLSFSGSLPSLCRALKVFTIARGIRNTVDFEYEKELLGIYKSQDGRIDGVYYMASPELNHVSSSAVRSIAAVGGDLSGYVPDSILEKVTQIYGKGGQNGGVVQST